MTVKAASGVARVAVILALFVAGCGGDDTEDPAVTLTPTDGAATAAGTASPASGSASEPDGGSSPSATAPTPSATGAGGTYTVEPGDNLTAIAERFGTTVDAIVEANDIEDPNVIDVGQELTIPPS